MTHLLFCILDLKWFETFILLNFESRSSLIRRSFDVSCLHVSLIKKEIEQWSISFLFWKVLLIFSVRWWLHLDTEFNSMDSVDILRFMSCFHYVPKWIERDPELHTSLMKRNLFFYLEGSSRVLQEDLFQYNWYSCVSVLCVFLFHSTYFPSSFFSYLRNVKVYKIHNPTGQFLILCWY